LQVVENKEDFVGWKVTLKPSIVYPVTLTMGYKGLQRAITRAKSLKTKEIPELY